MPPASFSWGTLQHSYGYEQQPDRLLGSSSLYHASSGNPHSLAGAMAVKLEPGAADGLPPFRYEQHDREAAWCQESAEVQAQHLGLGHDLLLPPPPPPPPPPPALLPLPPLPPPPPPLLPPPPPHLPLRQPHAGASGPFPFGEPAAAYHSTSPPAMGSPLEGTLQPSRGSSPSPATLQQQAEPARPNPLKKDQHGHEKQLGLPSGMPAAGLGQQGMRQQQLVVQAGSHRDRSGGETAELAQREALALVEAHAVATSVESVMVVMVKYANRELRRRQLPKRGSPSPWVRARGA